MSSESTPKDESTEETTKDDHKLQSMQDSIIEGLKQRIDILEHRLNDFQLSDRVLDDLIKTNDKVLNRKSELESKAVSMITMSGTIATIFMGFGSVLLRDIPLEEFGFVVSAFTVLMVEVILTTLVIRYSLIAYKLPGEPYFDLFLSLFKRDSDKNRQLIMEWTKSDPQIYVQNMIDSHLSGIPRNSAFNDNKTVTIVRAQQLFLYALTMVPIFAFIIVVYRLL